MFESVSTQFDKGQCLSYASLDVLISERELIFIIERIYYVYSIIIKPLDSFAKERSYFFYQKVLKSLPNHNLHIFSIVYFQINVGIYNLEES